MVRYINVRFTLPYLTADGVELVDGHGSRVSLPEVEYGEKIVGITRDKLTII